MKKTFKNLSVVIFLLLTVSVLAESKGNFYRINNTSGVRGVRALAAHIAVPRTSFRYTPGTQKMGILDDLCLSDYAISPDRSTLALSESQTGDDGKFLNRIIFFEFAGLNIINGIEYTSDSKIEQIFFFRNNLYCITKGDKINIKQLILTKNLQFDQKSAELESDVSSIICDRNFIYIKSVSKKMWQFDENLNKISTIDTRFDGGFLLIRDVKNDKIINFSKENVETLQRTAQGLFKSSFRDLKDVPKPEQAWLSPIKNSIYFSTEEGKLFELVDMAYSEQLDVTYFQQVLYHPYKREFYLLAQKKHIIEIVSLRNFKMRKRISHNTMRPETHRNLKFIIPHPAGIFIITQQGEFALIREYKIRFYKVKY